MWRVAYRSQTDLFRPQAQSLNRGAADRFTTYSRPMLLAVPLLVLMIGTAVPAWLGDRPAAVVLALEGVAWLIVDKWFEGPTLVRISENHGLVLADLVGFAAICVAAVCLLRTRDHDGWLSGWRSLSVGRR